MGRGRIILDHIGRPAHPIKDKDGKVIGTSRNLAGIRRYVSKNLIKRIGIENDNLSGILAIDFDNGARYRTDFASYTVLCGWVLRWRNAHGAPLWINGVNCGKLDKHNETLKAHAENGGIKNAAQNSGGHALRRS